VSTCDCVVIGTGGGVGSAALYHLARRGARTVGLDRFPPGHDRGSSHGDTRVIRLAYFEHPDYVPLLVRAYELWEELAALHGEALYRETGLLQIGPEGGAVVSGVLRSAREHGLEVEALSAREVEARHPGFRVPGGMVGVFERRAGYLRVEECVRAHAGEAVRRGARLEIGAGAAVRSFEATGSTFMVTTESGERWEAPRVVVAPGAWAPDLLAGLGLRFEVRRKALFWIDTSDPAHDADSGCPVFLYETPAGVFYGFPRIAPGEGMKVAEHTGGDAVPDPLAVDRTMRPADHDRIAGFLRDHVPGATGRVLRHVVCMYTMTPDQHFVVDRHPAHEGVVFAAGLSGHGFKFASVLGEVLADLALDGHTARPIGFLGAHRPGLAL
jgi:monomeric sarcosine oxidase